MVLSRSAIVFLFAVPSYVEVLSLKAAAAFEGAGSGSCTRKDNVVIVHEQQFFKVSHTICDRKMQ